MKDFHLLSPTSTGNLANAFIKYGLDAKYIDRALLTALTSASTFPIRAFNAPRLSRKLKSVSLGESPIFIIGHWRSGTTYLHNILSQDPRFGFITLSQCLTPYAPSRNPLLESLIQRNVPTRRMLDNVDVSLNAPQEEELAISSISYNSYIHACYFPKKRRKIFDNHVLFEGHRDPKSSQRSKQRWEKNYLRVLKHATLRSRKNQLLLKEPSNTARIRHLLQLFPHAKFVHIYRNPYDVFASTRNLYFKMSPYIFQSLDHQQLEDDIFYIYKRLMKKFFDDESLIPSSNLIHIRYEALESRPFYEIERIYRELEISNFEMAYPHIEKHIRSKASYKKNQYRLSAFELDKIQKHWHFAIDRWQYTVPEKDNVNTDTR